MGFLAFLVVGGLSGVFAWVFYPRMKKAKLQLKKILPAIVIGFMAALTSSYAGQFVGLFQSGQILEWLSAIVAGCLAGCFYAATVK
jgi:fluoride ion exporter CrcB/FEX